MTRFEKDLNEIAEGNGTEVMKRRKAELAEIMKKGKAEKNSFKMQCLVQDYKRLSAEYDKLDEMF